MIFLNMRIMIDSKEDWMELFRRLRNAGLLKDIPEEDVELSEDLFPMEFFMDLDPIINLVENPIVKPFKSRIDGTLTRCVEDAIM